MLLQDEFKKAEGIQIGEAFVSSPFWIRIDIQNNSDQRDWIIECPNILLDSLTIYQPSKNLESTTGMLIPMENRSVKASTLAFEIQTSKEIDTIYFRSKSSTLSEVPLRLVEKATFVENQTSKTILFGILIGIFILFSTLTLITFLIKKEKVFLLLFLYSVVSTLNNSHFGGLSFYWYPQSQFFLKWILIGQVNLTFWLIIAYSSEILEVRHRYPKVFRWFRFVYLLPLTMLLSALLIPIQYVVMIHSIVPQLALLLFGGWGMFLFYKGNKNALFYSIGWIVHFLFLAPYILANFGILPSNLFTENSGGIGLLVELFFFAIASSLYFKQKMQERELTVLLQSQELNKAKIQIDNYLKNSASELKAPISNEAMLKLSEREFEILRLILEGKNNPAIADAIYVSVNTVKTHIKSIYTKMQVHSRVELVKKLSGIEVPTSTQ